MKNLKLILIEGQASKGYDPFRASTAVHTCRINLSSNTEQNIRLRIKLSFVSYGGNWCLCRTQTDTQCLFESQTEISFSIGVYQADTRYPFQLGRASLRLDYISMLNHWGIHKLTSISLYYLPYTNRTFVDALIVSLSYYHLLKVCRSSICK